jgi:hypothetical protein
MLRWPLKKKTQGRLFTGRDIAIASRTTVPSPKLLFSTFGKIATPRAHIL